MTNEEKRIVLPKIHDKELEMLKEIDRMCSLLGIHYFICYGTLLGAVRHKGFIPWDDDADVVMLRPEYDIFMREYKKYIDSSKFYIDSLANPNFFFPFSKIRYKNTLMVQSFNEKGKNNEIWVDIFPLDNVPNDSAERKHYFKSIITIENILLKRLVPSSSNVKTFFKKTLGYLYPCSTVALKKKMVKKMKRYENDNSCLFVGNVTNTNYCLTKSFFAKQSLYLFENAQLYGPFDYDGVLKTLYGNYLLPPPEDQRYAGHDIVEVKI
jgi:lipopolysaccharide cholinephosphotransferase